jgi:hypothetical protein
MNTLAKTGLVLIAIAVAMITGALLTGIVVGGAVGQLAGLAFLAGLPLGMIGAVLAIVGLAQQRRA